MPCPPIHPDHGHPGNPAVRDTLFGPVGWVRTQGAARGLRAASRVDADMLFVSNPLDRNGRRVVPA